MGRIGIAVVAALVLGGCFSKPGFMAGGDDDVPPDDAAIDGAIDAPGSCTAMSARCVTPDLLETCATAGAAPQTQTCPWTCTALGSGPHCRGYRPAGGTLTPTDLLPDASLADAMIGNTTLDGSTGEIVGVRTAGPDVISGIRFDARAAVGVFRFKSLVITGPIALQGNYAIALVADGPIRIEGVIDGTTSCISTGTTAGGGFGGGPNASGIGFGGGQGGLTNNDQGGAGGGHGHRGGDGGVNMSTRATGGAAFPFMEMRGGGGGGGGKGTGGAGGSGGAAIQLASNHSITITPTGGINAGGCGGRVTTTNTPGGGGGAGGLILIEAYDVAVQGKLAVNGGGGSAGEAGAPAPGNGLLARTAAAGATAFTGQGHGAAGGYGVANQAALMQGQAPTLLSSNGGGGGGGVGRIVINTADGQVAVSGVMSPAFTDVGTTAIKGMILAQ